MMMDAAASGLANYARFAGRASRREFNGWMLLTLAALAGALLLDEVVVGPLTGFDVFAIDSGRPLTVATTVLLLIPTLAVTVRRLHDVGRGGVWALLLTAPVLGWLALGWMLCRPGQMRTNRHGEPAELLEQL